MATQIVTKTGIESNNAFRLGDILPRSLWSPYKTSTPAFVKGSERASDGSAGDGNCFTGAFVALAIEFVAALAVYGIWLLWHFVR